MTMGLAGKRLLVLGGSDAQLVLIRKATALGVEVIVADQDARCPGARFASRFHPASTTDAQALLAVARTEEIDGVVTFASDPSALAVAEVAAALSLPGNPVEAVRVLAHKDRFRAFLAANGFVVPKTRTIASAAEAPAAAIDLAGDIMVKPADSSGSRGITRLGPGQRTSERLAAAAARALGFSRAKRAVIEEYLPRQGYHLGGDGFLVDGQLAVCRLGNDHHFESFNPLVPIGHSFPSVWPESEQTRIRAVVQDIMTRLGMRIGGLNFDIHLLPDGRIFVIEIGPRAGGNLIAEVVSLATGEDMVEAAVLSALGKPVRFAVPRWRGCFASHVLHIRQPGIFQGLHIADALAPHVEERRLYFQPGARFTAEQVDNHRLYGALILRFDDVRQMTETMDRLDTLVWAEMSERESGARRARA